jgi:putative DNA primase/helicase
MWLVHWLAYPLQNVGGKMGTAVLMHSEMQGSGKSLFFGKVMRKIFGAEYSSTLGQHQLESSYTDWRSKMLYGVFEEIFSRDQKYSHTGTMKEMITGETQRIEKKFMSGWEEANHMNAVFLSNEIQPFPVEPFDRRMLVIWPEGKLDKALVKRVLDELNNGGAEAFYNHLLQLNLEGFASHTEPPMTEAKERLIDFGRAGWDSFYQEWSKGYLKVPYSPCLIVDLYESYKNWCHSGHERQVSLKKFSDFMSVPSRGKRKRDVWYQVGQGKKKGTFLIVGEPPSDMPQSTWLGRCVSEFQKELRECA